MTSSVKSSVAQIRERFDNDVERFSNLAIGQSAAIDSPLCMELVTQAAAAINPQATCILDIGCGAGNYTLKLLEKLPHRAVTLVDLSRPMLDRAGDRVGQVSEGQITTIQADIRELRLGEAEFDVIMAASVLHHLRGDEEWAGVFAKLYAALKPGGSFWVFDLIEHSPAQLQALMWRRYGHYLTEFRDAAYRDQVFSYIAEEDTPRPLLYQIDLLRQVGFSQVEILHKNSCFAAFGGLK